MLKQARSSLNLIFWSSLLPMFELFAYFIAMVFKVRVDNSPAFSVLELGCALLYLYGLYRLSQLTPSLSFTKNLRWALSLSTINLIVIIIALMVSGFQSTELFRFGAFSTIYSLLIIYGIVLLCRAIQELCKMDSRYRFLYKSWKQVEALYIWGQIVLVLFLLLVKTVVEAVIDVSDEGMGYFWLGYGGLYLLAFLLPWVVFLVVLRKTLTEIRDEDTDDVLDAQI
ncbi:MAG: hypothetical protein AAGG75_13215 [Bacteroidota bacterium]